jgi:hypothetical protein
VSDAGDRLHGQVVEFLGRILDQDKFGELTGSRDRLQKLLTGYVRSPSFIARYFPPQLVGDEVGVGTGSFAEAIERAQDLSGTTLRHRVEEFLRFATELAVRGRAASAATDAEEWVDPLGKYLKAVADSVRTRQVARDEGLADGQGRSVRALHVVRRVIGDTPRQVRERVMEAFNSPLFPEILISSSVLGEGVDLHRFCRFVIHHDLSWNPSVIEQRTGRLDRIRCRAEMTGRPIVVYQPYIGESADEKLYRVVRDRETWFQIVMGQRFTFSERKSDEIAERVPLPGTLAQRLLFDLRRL